MLDDWRTAPVDDKLRAVLGYLEKVTLTPEAVTAADLAPLRAAGVSDRALIDAVYVCALFNLIDRVADALGFDVPASFARGAADQLRRGYRMG